VSGREGLEELRVLAGRKGLEGKVGIGRGRIGGFAVMEMRMGEWESGRMNE
jgi:hypothetical protein